MHKLDAFQTTKVVSHYENIAEARKAIQRNEIYAFLLIPKGTESGLMTSNQPKISFYYSSVSLAAGSLLFRDLKTISTLGGAAAGMAKLSALGKTNDEIMTFLQPIAIDLHMTGNPYANYNYYLSSVMVPGIIMLFIFLITPYSIGTELKFNRAKDWMRMANNNPFLAIAGKMLPQTLIFLSIFLLFEFYIYYVLGFPHPGVRSFGARQGKTAENHHRNHGTAESGSHRDGRKEEKSYILTHQRQYRRGNLESVMRNY